MNKDLEELNQTSVLAMEIGATLEQLAIEIAQGDFFYLKGNLRDLNYLMNKFNSRITNSLEFLETLSQEHELKNNPGKRRRS